MEFGETSDGRLLIVSSNKVSTSLWESDICSAEDSRKFRRLDAGPKLLCSETITLSSDPKLSCSEAIPVESVKKERRDKTENMEPQV